MLASEEILSLDEIYKAHNEISQIKLAMEREALFGDGRLPKEIVDYRERKHNLEYFQQSLSARTIKIYNYIGKPFWPSLAELSDTQVSREVDRMLLLLAQNGIEISISDPHTNADDRKLYTFITETVFPRKIKEIRLPGVSYSIDYNYYYPDYTHLCIFIADELLTGLFEPNYERLDSCLSQQFYINNDSREDLYASVIEKFDAYRTYLDEFVLVGWTVEGIDLDETQRTGVVHLELHYGVEKNKKTLFTEKGQLVCQGKENNWWTIHRIEWPGLLLE